MPILDYAATRIASYSLTVSQKTNPAQYRTNRISCLPKVANEAEEGMSVDVCFQGYGAVFVRIDQNQRCSKTLNLTTSRDTKAGLYPQSQTRGCWLAQALVV